MATGGTEVGDRLGPDHCGMKGVAMLAVPRAGEAAHAGTRRNRRRNYEDGRGRRLLRLDGHVAGCLHTGEG
jgi:hypothetical protein